MVRQFSAGGLVFKKAEDRILWLIRKPAVNENYHGNTGWSFPKGWIDEGEKREEAAAREVREEGGVMATVMKKLVTIKVFFTSEKKERVMKFITYFLMKYEGDVPEGFGWETAEVKWVTREEAETLLAYKKDKDNLRIAQRMVEEGEKR